MTKTKSQLAVIEGKWEKRSNISIKGLFDILSDIYFDSPHSYIYEMFCDAAALNNIIKQMGEDKQVRYIYVGCHGSLDSISGSGGKVSKTQLKNTLVRLSGNGSIIEGIFLGTCFFGQQENAEFLLIPPKNNNPPIKWVAGYTESIDWIDSSVLDLLFWKKFFESSGTPVERIRYAAQEIKRAASGLIEELGFCIYVRKKGPGGGVKNLLA